MSKKFDSKADAFDNKLDVIKAAVSTLSEEVKTSAGYKNSIESQLAELKSLIADSNNANMMRLAAIEEMGRKAAESTEKMIKSPTGGRKKAETNGDKKTETKSTEDKVETIQQYARRMWGLNNSEGKKFRNDVDPDGKITKLVDDTKAKGSETDLEAQARVVYKKANFKEGKPKEVIKKWHEKYKNSKKKADTKKSDAAASKPLSVIDDSDLLAQAKQISG